MSREPWNKEENVLTVSLGSVAWAKPGKTLLEEGLYKLFLTGQVVVSQMGKATEGLPSRKYRELCCSRKHEKARDLRCSCRFRVQCLWGGMVEGSACIWGMLNIKESGFNPKANSLMVWQAFISPAALVKIQITGPYSLTFRVCKSEIRLRNLHFKKQLYFEKYCHWRWKSLKVAQIAYLYEQSFVFFCTLSTFLQVLLPFCVIQGKLKGTTEMIHCWVLPWICDALQFGHLRATSCCHLCNWWGSQATQVGLNSLVVCKEAIKCFT